MPRRYMLHPCSTQEVHHYLQKNGRGYVYLGRAIFSIGVIDGVTFAPRMIGVATCGVSEERALQTPYVLELLALEKDITDPDIISFILSAAMNAASALGYHILVTKLERDIEAMKALGFVRRWGRWAVPIVAKPIGFEPDPAPALPPKTAGFLDI